MTGDYFIFAGGQRADDQRRQQALGENAPDELIHFFVIRDLEGVAFKGFQFVDRQMFCSCFFQ